MTAKTAFPETNMSRDSEYGFVLLRWAGIKTRPHFAPWFHVGLPTGQGRHASALNVAFISFHGNTSMKLQWLILPFRNNIRILSKGCEITMGTFLIYMGCRIFVVAFLLVIPCK